MAATQIEKKAHAEILIGSLNTGTIKSDLH